MNSYISSIELENQVFIIYSNVSFRLESIEIVCPKCGKKHTVYIKQMENKIKNIEKSKKRIVDTLYIDGSVVKIIDKDIFEYFIQTGGEIFHVVSSEEREALNRIFLRKGYHLCISGYIRNLPIERNIKCTCGEQLSYFDKYYFVLENKSRIIMDNKTPIVSN